MKIEQEQPKFNPITLTLETREEAESLLSLMDRIGECNAAWRQGISVSKKLTKAEAKLAIAISDAFTECKVTL